MTTTATDAAACPLFSRRIISAAWIVNAALFLTLVVWIWNDRRFTDQYPRQVALSSIKILPGQPPPTTHEFWPSRVRLRWGAVRVLISVATVTFAAIVAGLFLGDARHRRLRSWFMLLTLAAAWLAVATSYGEIMWASRIWTMSGRVDAFESYAAPLRREWPSEDGATPEFGAFSAYPVGKPTMLSLLTTPMQFDRRGWGFSAVDRSADGTLRFRLTGDISGWLEWHPAGSAPQSFEDGLNVQHELTRAKGLGRGWYYTTYGPG